MSDKLKCGIEVHQRMDTNKLFCNCPSKEGKDAGKVIKRYLHAVKSEMGEKDITSQFEQKRKIQYKYDVYDNTCLVEADEEPPHELNAKALDIVLEIASLLHSNIVDEIQIMRKTVIDGSNTSGFQRTAIAGIGGRLDTSKGKVRIQTICIEEESAGIVEKRGDTSEYRLDRLGIPLIEIATEPDIVSAEHAREVAEKIGTMMRITGKVLRGIGTIRQDVNISIPSGARVEIKGAQELDSIVGLVENEVLRQKNLGKLIKEVKKRFDGKVDYKLGIVDLTEIFEDTNSKIIKKIIKKKGKVLGAVIPKHKGLLGMELLPGFRYGTELSDYAKTAGVKGIIHSDENFEKYKFIDEEIASLKIALEPGKEDAFILVGGPEGIARDAIEKVYERTLVMAIPKETRKADEEKSHFMRPLAGSARMYPETDVPPITVSEKRLKEIQKNMGKGLEKTKESLEKLLNKDLAEKMLKSKHLKLFMGLAEKGYDPKLVASTLEQSMVEVRREGFDTGKITDDQLKELFNQHKKGLFVKSAVLEILKGLSKEEKVEDIVKEKELGKISSKELDKIIKQENGDFRSIMTKYRLRVDAREVQEKLKKK